MPLSRPANAFSLPAFDATSSHARQQPAEPLVPAFAVKLNDRPLATDIALWITRVTVEDVLDGPSMFTLQLISREEERGTQPWTDDPRLALGATVEIRMGYGADLTSLIVGDITALEPSFSVTGPPTLLVRGYDRRNRLNGARRHQRFQGKTDADIATILCTDLITVESTDSEVTHDEVVQWDQTDLAFLSERARRIGYELAMDVTDRKKLLFRKKAHAAPAVATLTLRDDLLEFHPRMLLDPVTELVAVSWDPKTKGPISASAKAGSIAGMDGRPPGSQRPAKLFGDGAEKMPRTPAASQAEANQLAIGAFNMAALEYITGDGRARGRTDLLAGRVVVLGGLGEVFSGSYYVTHATHSYSPRAGYLTDFQVERNAS
jgi:Bacteriophage probable baseplate hub protein